ncbi:hypothetical protein ACLOJK_040326 [Asimina triloba]
MNGYYKSKPSRSVSAWNRRLQQSAIHVQHLRLIAQICPPGVRLRLDRISQLVRPSSAQHQAAPSVRPLVPLTLVGARSASAIRSQQKPPGSARPRRRQICITEASDDRHRLQI